MALGQCPQQKVLKANFSWQPTLHFDGPLLAPSNCSSSPSLGFLFFSVLTMTTWWALDQDTPPVPMPKHFPFQVLSAPHCFFLWSSFVTPFQLQQHTVLPSALNPSWGLSLGHRLCSERDLTAQVFSLFLYALWTFLCMCEGGFCSYSLA